MQPLKLFGQPTCSEVARVLACLFEKKVEFQLFRVDSYYNQDKVSELRKPHDQRGEVLLKDGKLVLDNSRDICRYICETYPKGGNKLYGIDIPENTTETNGLKIDRSRPPLTGSDTNNPSPESHYFVPERNLIEPWLLLEEFYFDPAASELIFYLAFPPELSMKPDELALEKSKEKVSNVLDFYNRWLENNIYLAGPNFTLADLMHLPNLHYLFNMSGMRDKLFYGRRNVEKWINNVLPRESWRKVEELQNDHQKPTDVLIK